jgi:hypothetical protein
VQARGRTSRLKRRICTWPRSKCLPERSMRRTRWATRTSFGCSSTREACGSDRHSGRGIAGDQPRPFCTTSGTGHSEHISEARSAHAGRNSRRSDPSEGWREIIAGVLFPFPVASLILCHHERWTATIS